LINCYKKLIIRIDLKLVNFLNFKCLVNCVITKNREWSSKLIFILAAIGSAVGLGNYWRFPYVTGVNGGGAFILVYFICIILIGIPLMLFEISAGKRFKTSVYNILKRFGKEKLIIIPLISTFMILSFYSVLVGWTLSYSGYSVVSMIEMNKFPIPEFDIFSTTYFGIFSFITVIILTTLPVYFGIKGIEKFVKYAIPIMVFITLILLGFALRLPDAHKGIDFFLNPDISKIFDLDTWLIAISQVTFSLSVGGGMILTYSSYSKKSDIIKDTASIVSADVFIALIAGLVIFSTVFSFGLKPSEGPSLMFSTLPHVFNSITFGSLLAFPFYFILLLAGLTSTVSMMEYLISNLKSMLKIKRKPLVILISILISVIGLPVALSFSPMNLTFMGKTFLDWYDRLFITTTVPIVILITLSIAMMWKKNDFVKTIIDNSNISKRKARVIVNWIRYVIPIVIIILIYQAAVGLIGFIK